MHGTFLRKWLLVIVWGIIPVFAAEAPGEVAEAGAGAVKEQSPAMIGIIVIDDDYEDDIPAMVKNLHRAGMADINGLLLLFDAGGGSAGRWDFLREEIEQLRKSKPVIGVIIGYCASGAYLAAAACDTLLAPSQASVGSIGAFFKVDHYEGMRRQGPGVVADLTTETFAAGKYKTIGHPDRPSLSTEERLYVQAWVNRSHQLLCEQIARLRNLSLENKSVWGEGQMFPAIDALALGLIDGLGGVTMGIKRIVDVLKEKELAFEGFKLIEINSKNQSNKRSKSDDA